MASICIPEFDLQRYNTLGVPATAAYYWAVTTIDELLAARLYARERNLPLLILGGGSNLILSPRFEGLVVHLKLQGIECLQEDQDGARFRVAAGENWHAWVMHSLTLGFSGLENLALIPGTVGAAPIQNIGAYGVEVESLIEEVEALEIASGVRVTFTRDACQFAYRDSFFKQAGRDRYVITAVVFKLGRASEGKAHYPGIAEALAGRAPTPLHIAEAVMAVRKQKLPDPAKIPNVGSFFKNPVVDMAQFATLIAGFSAMPHYPAAHGKVKLAAGWLIDQAGWRGREFAGAVVHPQQALVLTNPQHLSSDAVLALAAAVQQAVREKFGVMLELEPRIY